MRADGGVVAADGAASQRGVGAGDEKGRLGAAESRLNRTTGERIRALERAIEHEWEALQRGPRRARKELREQAASLGESASPRRI